MANVTAYYTHTATGSTLYAFPVGQSLENWTTLREPLTEAAAPNLYRYSGTLSTTYPQWVVFSGASQPSGWDQAVSGVIDLTDGVLSVLPGYVTQQKAKQLNELIVPLLSKPQQALTCYNTDGTAQSLNGLTLQFVVSIEDETEANGQRVIDTIDNSDITVSGASSNVATFRYTDAMVELPRRLIWSLRDVTTTNNIELQGGSLNVRVSASE